MLDNWTTRNILIGEMAKMHNISPKMLRYWDKIGVLKPAETDKINGYRYYTTQQFHMLNFIVYMRSMGLTYVEIKKWLNNINQNSLHELLDSQIQLTDEKIQELQSVKSTLEILKKDILSALQIQQTGGVKIEHFPERKIISIDGSIRTRFEFEKTIMRLENKIRDKTRLLVSKIGLLMDETNFENGRFDIFNGIFLFQEDYIDCSDLIQTLPSGYFVTLYFWGKTEDSSCYFRKMLDYIRENSLVITGNIMRMVVATGMRIDNEGHLAQIQIPVNKL